jgi:hypothetical protein
MTSGQEADVLVLLQLGQGRRTCRTTAATDRGGRRAHGRADASHEERGRRGTGPPTAPSREKAAPLPSDGPRGRDPRARHLYIVAAGCFLERERR